MTLIHRQDDNGNQPPQGGGDTNAGDAQPTDGGGQASLPFVDPSTVTTTATSSATRTTAVIPPTNNAAGVVPVGSGVAQDPAGFATQLSGTLTVNVPTGTVLTVADASATSAPSGSQPVTALGLSLPVLIGIIAGVFAFLIIVLIVVIVLYRRAGRKRRAQNSLHSHDAEGSPYAGGRRGSGKKADELTPPPTPAPLSHKALMQEKQRDMAALDALVSALDKAEARSGAQRYDPSRSGPGAGSVAKLKVATAARQSDFIEWDDEEEGSEFETKRQKRRTVDMLPDAEVFRAAIAPKS